MGKWDWQQWHLLAARDNCAGGLGMLPSSLRLGWRASVTSHSVLHGSLLGSRDPATGWSPCPNKILPYITRVCMVLQLEGENRLNNIKISWPEANEEFVFGVIFFFFWCLCSIKKTKLEQGEKCFRAESHRNEEAYIKQAHNLGFSSTVETDLRC